MTIKKMFKYNPEFKNKTWASVTLHQGNNCGGSNPVNVTISSNGPVVAFF